MLFSTSILVSVLSAATFTLGFPVPSGCMPGGFPVPTGFPGSGFNSNAFQCPLTNVKPTLPKGQSTVAIPGGQVVFVGLGVGIQVN